MKIRSILKGAALIVATLLVLLILILSKPILHIWKSYTYSSITAPNAKTQFELRKNTCEIATLFMNGPATNFEWKEVKEISLTTFHNCLGYPERLYLSSDETTLFVRRNADREEPRKLAPDAPRGYWSDVIDVSAYPPKLIRGLGACCWDETVVPKAETDKFIENIAREKGVAVKPF